MTNSPHLFLGSRCALAVVALSLGTLVACNNPGAAVSPQTTTMTATPETTEKVTSLADATTDDEQQSPTGEWDLELVEVRSGNHEGYDRVVFEFTGTGTPGWFTGYQSEPRQQTSGYLVEMGGDSFLEVGVPGMAMLDTRPVGLIEGAGDQGIINDIYFGSVFEAQGQFIIGIDGDERPYQVTVLDSPTRLVIDFVDG